MQPVALFTLGQMVVFLLLYFKLPLQKHAAEACGVNTQGACLWRAGGLPHVLTRAEPHERAAGGGHGGQVVGAAARCAGTLDTLISNPKSQYAQADCPTFSPGQSRTNVLQAAAMAAKWWEPPRDALEP